MKKQQQINKQYINFSDKNIQHSDDMFTLQQEKHLHELLMYQFSPNNIYIQFLEIKYLNIQQKKQTDK